MANGKCIRLMVVLIGVGLGLGAKGEEGVALAVREGRARSWIPAREGRRSVLVVSVMGTSPETFPVRVRIWPAGDAGHGGQVDGSPLVSAGKRHQNVGDCQPVAARERGIAGKPAGRREFWVFRGGGDVASRSSYGKSIGVLRAVTEEVEVYVEETEVERVSGERILEVVRAFQKVKGPVEDLLGACEDEDEDGRFAFLFTSSLAGFGSGSGAVDGLFRATDLDEQMPRPFGNRCDLIYLNPAIRGGGHLEAVVAHEYAHAAYASRKKTTAGTDAHEDNWLDEAVAHVAEDLATGERSNIDYRVRAYLDDPARFGLVVEDYYRAGLFRSHGHRGAAYLFLRWCVEHEGPGVLRRLAESEKTGRGAVAEVFGRDFEAIYREWACEMATKGAFREGREPFAGIDLSGSFGSVELAGMRAEKVGDRKGREWLLPATATKVVEVVGEEDVEVVVEAPEGAGLQVTWLSLEER